MSTWEKFEEKNRENNNRKPIGKRELLSFFSIKSRAFVKGTEDTVVDDKLLPKMEDAIPDYDRWARVFHTAGAFLAVLMLLIDGLISFHNIISGETGKLSPLFYVLIRTVLPFVISCLLVLIGYMTRKKHESNLLSKCYIPILVYVLLCLTANISNPEICVIYSLFAVPPMMTIIFWNRKMTWEVSSVCSLAVVVSSVSGYFIYWRHHTAIFCFASSFVALLVIAGTYDILRICIVLNEKQRNTLIKVANDASEAEEREKELNERKSEFLASMSHEIRTPINAVLGMDELILRETESANIRSYAEGIMSSGNNLLYLINDILDISKIESGKFEIVDVAYDVSSMIHDCCSMVADRMKKKGLAFKLECEESIPNRLKGDEYRVRQVVTNILTNAAKYTEQGSVTLSVGGMKQEDVFHLAISVKDTGIGIKEEDLTRLFGQFTRFDTERNRNVEGSGLGLSITKQLVNLMGGEIKVESVYGKGSTFIIELPQPIVDEHPIGNIHLRFRESSTTSTYRYKKTFEAPEARILVVDDVTINLKVFTGLLKETKMQVDTADSGARALEMIGQAEYDIIFLDHMMPGMDGIEVFKRMKDLQTNKETPVIMLTANAVEGAMDEYIKAGFTHYLSKPVKSDRLESVIRRYLSAEKLIDLSEDKEKPAVTQEEAKEEAPKGIQVRNEAEAKAVLKSIFKAYPIMNLKDGKQYCGNDMELYLESIQMMIEDSPVDELEHYMDEKDMKNYAILIHGFKSSSRSIGCNKISDLAASLEEAAKRSDEDFVEVNHAEFMEELEKFFTAVKKVLNQ